MPESSVLQAAGVLGPRALLALAALSVLLGAAVWQSLAVKHASLPPATHTAVATHAGLSNLPAAARAPISAALGADWPAYHVRAADDGLHAVSRPEHLSAHFDRSGVTLSSGSVRLGMSLRAVGYGSSLHRLGDVNPTATANRVNYAHDGLSEWYINGPLGLEQGFTVWRAPSAHAGGAMSLSLGLSGNAHAFLSSGRQDIVLRRAGAASLRYGGLVAADATGRKLPSWFALGNGAVLLRVDTSGARFPITIDPLVQQDDKPTPNGEQGEGRFGLSVALSANGSTALIGAPGDNGFAGAAWVFTRSGSTWTQQGPKLTVDEQGGEPVEAQCTDESAECGFGRSVALSADGSTALIGAPRNNEYRGAAWVFTRTGSTWSQTGEKLTGGAEEKGKGRFGRSVALSADGDTALIGGPRDRSDRGGAWAFTRIGSGFVQQGAKLTGNEELGVGYFGRSVALSSDGGTALIGGPGDNGNAGATWVFTHSGAGWSAQGAKITGGAEEAGKGRFGFSVALNADGNIALIGARDDGEGVGAAWVFARAGLNWAQQGSKLTGEGEVGEGQFGSSTTISANGDTALVGAPRDSGPSGAAWTFTRSGTGWAPQGGKLASDVENSNSAFGTSVALAADGSTALIGGPRATSKLGEVWSLLGPPAPLPNVTGIDPASGPAAGGTSVTITGSGFLGGAAVTIGSAATSVTVISETEITAVTTATPAGSAEVVVTNLNGASTGGPSYTYLSPTPVPVTDDKTATSGPSLTSPPGDLGVLANIAAVLPLPKLTVTGNLTRLAGVVRVKLPGSATFTLLTAGRQIPFGSIVDATLGRVAVTTASPHGGVQTMIFYKGEFKLTQRRSGLTVSTLVGGSYSVCPTARQRKHLAHASAKRGKRSVRKLWAEGHGTYSTKGNYATGAVLGTRWLTEDLCEGTLFRVVTDRVAVTNLVTKRRVIVKAGESYLAKAP